MGYTMLWLRTNFRSLSPYHMIVQAGGKRDLLTGQRRNKANNVSFSNKKSRKWQELNLRRKKIYWSGGQRIVSLRISARTIKTIEKNGLLAMASNSGINLWQLPFQDARPQRKDFLNEKPVSVPRPKNCKKKLQNPV